MTTLPLRAPNVPLWHFPGFGRFVSFVTTFLDVFVEAHNEARKAHERFPFADW